MRLRYLGLAISVLLLASCLDTTVADVALIDCSTLALTADSTTVAAMTRTTSGASYRDINVGTGADVAVGQTVTFRYAGCLLTGLRFDSNEAPQALLTVKVGSGQLIKGFDEGVVGMKIGGRRELVIPPNLGYGSAVVGGIPANSTLVFNVFANSIQ